MYDHMVGTAIVADLFEESYYEKCKCADVTECAVCNGHGVLLVTDYDVCLSDNNWTKQKLTPIPSGVIVEQINSDTVTINDVVFDWYEPVKTIDLLEVQLKIEPRSTDLEKYYPELAAEGLRLAEAEVQYNDILEKCEMLEKLSK